MRLTINILCFILLAVLSQVKGGEWSSSNVTANGKRYYFNNKKLSWAEAKEECSNGNGWSLAVISNEKDNDAVLEVIREKIYESTWIGLQLFSNYTVELQTGEWVDGSTFNSLTSFHNWSQQEQKPPNDFYCAYLSDVKELQWDTKRCSTPLRFLCEERVPSLVQDGKIYYSIQEKLKWNEAHESCLRNNWTLATIHSEAGMDAIDKVLATQNKSTWIGLKIDNPNNQTQTGQWADNTLFNSSATSRILSTTTTSRSGTFPSRDIDNGQRVVENQGYQEWSEDHLVQDFYKCVQVRDTRAEKRRYKWFRSGCEAEFNYICEGKHDTVWSDSKVKENGKKYLFNTQRLDWIDARNECWKVGLNLAVLSSEVDYDTVLEVISEENIVESVWIGLELYPNYTKTWQIGKWVDGTTFNSRQR